MRSLKTGPAKCVLALAVVINSPSTINHDGDFEAVVVGVGAGGLLLAGPDHRGAFVILITLPGPNSIPQSPKNRSNTKPPKLTTPRSAGVSTIPPLGRSDRSDANADFENFIVGNVIHDL